MSCLDYESFQCQIWHIYKHVLRYSYFLLGKDIYNSQINGKTEVI